ncbi:MAG: Fic family protein [Flavobacteriales bacterium]
MLLEISDICGMEWMDYPWGEETLRDMLSRIEEKKKRLDKLRPFAYAALSSLRESVMMEWTYHSNAIEGNTITLQETKVILSDGITVGGKSLREHFETLNHHEAISRIESMTKPTYRMKAADILEIHGLVLQRIEKEYAGRYRNAGVRITGANFNPPNALKVDALMEELIAWTNSNDKRSVLVRAMIFHHRMVWIHPFFDGNGRTVRLIFNLILMSAGYPPAIILQQDRKKYYDALNKSNQGNYEKLMLLVLQSLERTLDIYLSHIQNKNDSYRSVASVAKEKDIPYGQEYISLLIRRGHIAGYKEGRNWLTTEESVRAYLKSKAENKSSKRKTKT